MATKRISGITVEIGGDTVALNKALASTNSAIRDTASQLRDVEKLLKLDPGNTTLITQQQELYAKQIEETKNKLDALKEAERQVQAQFAKGTATADQYSELQREVIKAEQALGKLETAAKEAAAESTKTAQAIDKISTAAGDLGKNATAAGQAFAPVSAAAGGLLAAGVALTEMTQEQSRDFAILENNARTAGQGIEEVDEAMRSLNAITGETDSNIEAVSNLLQAGYKDQGLLETVNLLSGAVLRFPDTLKIESLAESLQETVASGQSIGQFDELLTRLEIDTEAWNEQLAQASTEAQRLDLITQTLANAGLADVADQFRANNAALVENAELQYDMDRAMVELGDAIRPIVTDLMPILIDLLKSVSSFISSLSPETQQLIVVMLAITAAIAPLLLTIGSLATGFSSLLTLAPTLAPALAGVGAAASSAVAGVASLLAAFVSIPGAIVLVVGAVALFGDEIQSVLSDVNDFLQNVFAKDFSETFGVLGEILDLFLSIGESTWNGLLDVINGFVDVVRGAITGDIERVLDGIVTLFKGAFELIATVVLAPINLIIFSLNFLIEMLNAFLQELNKIKMPEILGGGSLFNFKTIGTIDYFDAGKITDDLFDTGKRSGSSSGSYGSTTVTNYNTINADDIAAVARMEQTLNGTRQSIRMG